MFCRDKHDKHVFVATKMILVATPANDREQRIDRTQVPTIILPTYCDWLNSPIAASGQVGSMLGITSQQHVIYLSASALFVWRGAKLTEIYFF